MCTLHTYTHSVCLVYELCNLRSPKSVGAATQNSIYLKYVYLAAVIHSMTWKRF